MANKKQPSKSKKPDLTFNFGASAPSKKPRDRSNAGKKEQRFRENVLHIDPRGGGS